MLEQINLRRSEVTQKLLKFKSDESVQDELIAKEQAARGMAGEAADIVHTSKRQEMKELIRSLRKTSPFIDANIMKSVENINLDACLGYVKDGVRRRFMDEYDER